MSILCVGKTGYDIELIINKNNKVIKKEETIVGTSLVISYLLSSWEEEVYFEGVVSSDAFGKKILEEIRNVRVNTDYVIESDLENTSVTYKIINENNKKEITESIKENEIKLHTNYKFKPKVIVSDLSELKFTEVLFNKYEDAIKVSIVREFNNSVPKICKNSTYIIMSLKVAESITSINADLNDLNKLSDLYRALETFYNKTIILDLGNMGSLYKEKDKIKLMGRIKGNYKETNRNIFYGAFVYGISNDLPIEKCVKISTISEYLSLKESNKSIFVPELGSVYEIYKQNK